MISQTIKISLQICPVEKLILEKKLIFADSSWSDLPKFELQKTDLTSNLIIDLVFHISRQNKDQLMTIITKNFNLTNMKEHQY